MTVINSSYPKFKYTIASTGQPGAGYKLFTYEEGTSTKKTTWTSFAKTAENTNPVVLDANGEADVWLDGNYKFVLAPPADTDPPASAVWTIDAIRSGVSASSSSTSGVTPTNGSFETDSDSDGTPDNWTITEYTGGTVAVVSTNYSHGAKSLKFTSTGSGGGVANTSDFYEVGSGGREVRLKFSIISADADTHNKVEIYWYNNLQTYLSATTAYDDSATNPTSWTRKVFRTTAPLTAVYCKVVITGVAADSATHSNTHFDDIDLDTKTGANRGAVVYRGTGFTIPNSVATAIDFVTELYDTDTIHDNVTNPSRLTVPTGVTRVRLIGNVRTSDDFSSIHVRKNGATAPCLPSLDGIIGSASGVNISSPILTVTSGDYFELFVYQGTGGDITTGTDDTWFAMEIIE